MTMSLSMFQFHFCLSHLIIMKSLWEGRTGIISFYIEWGTCWESKCAVASRNSLNSGLWFQQYSVHHSGTLPPLPWLKDILLSPLTPVISFMILTACKWSRTSFYPPFTDDDTRGPAGMCWHTNHREPPGGKCSTPGSGSRAYLFLKHRVPHSIPLWRMRGPACLLGLDCCDDRRP